MPIDFSLLFMLIAMDIVRALVETYGGSVQAQASVLGGARLLLYLPISESS